MLQSGGVREKQCKGKERESADVVPLTRKTPLHIELHKSLHHIVVAKIAVNVGSRLHTTIQQMHNFTKYKKRRRV